MGNEGSSLPPGADRSCPESAPGPPVGKDQAARLERFTRLYACLSQVNQAIVWTPERKALLDKICEVMVTYGKFSLAWVGWNDPINHEVAILSQFGDENGYLEGLRVRSDDTPLGRGGTGTAIRTGRSVVINDFLSSLESSPWHEKAARAGLAASAAFPIRTGGAVVGALMVYAREMDFFGIEELGLLEEAAGDLTFALDHLELDARNRESEATLKLNEELFSKIFKACPDAISIASMEDGTYVEVNQVFLDLMGLRREQVLGRTATDLGVWVDSGDRQHFVNQLARNGSLRHFETRFRMASGAIRDFEVSSEVIQFQGRPHSFNFMRDITERKLKAQALWESEAEFRLLFDKAPMGMAIVDSESGRFLAVNPRMGEILDCPPAELVTRSFQEFTHPDHLESDWKSVRDLAQGLAPEVRKEKRYIARSGRVVWVRLTMVLMPGMPRRQLSLVEDISEAHMAQASLKATLERLQKIADRVPGMVYQYRLRPDGTAHLPYASEAIRDIYRISPEAVRETAAALNGVHHPEDHAAIMASILASAETLTPWKQEYRVKFEDGTVRHLYGDALPEREPDGSTLWTGFITDITERKHLEAQFQQAQKMESLGSLAGGVAHDMNNVLAAILGLASAQQMRHEPGSTTYQAFEIIRSAATRGGSMVKNLLNFARQSPGEDGDVNLNEVLLGEVRLLERTTLAQVRLDMDLAPDLHNIRGDLSALTHAFMNLCVNAVDAMDGKGTLSLRTRNLDGGQVEVRLEDTGCGMSSAVLARAIDPFFTTKEIGKGTGLGLSMVYNTVKAHQGQMDIQSEPGHGTTVSLRFPSSEARRTEAESPSQARDSVAGPLHVLLVDDDDLVLAATEMLLEVLGHRVTTVTSGEAALAQLQEGARPDVVILDMNMPGLGGGGTLPRLRALCPDLPILLATGRADQSALDLIQDHQGVTLLPKPFSLDEIEVYLQGIAQAR